MALYLWQSLFYSCLAGEEDMGKVISCAFGAVFTSIVTFVWWANLFAGSMRVTYFNEAVAMLLVVSAATCWSIFMDVLKEYLNEQNIPD
jgi:hypothetical protein